MLAFPAASFAERPWNPEVQGHRGARWVRPENTLAAFEEALKAGVDVLEFDLNVTKDDVVVVTHDQRINPLICTGPEGKAPLSSPAIRSLTLAELKRYDCGSLRNLSFPHQTPSPGERIPTLDEVMAYVTVSAHPEAAGIRFNIETKINKHKPDLSPEPEEFVRLTLAVLRKYGVTGRTIIQSFDERTLEETKKQAPEVLTSRLTGNPFDLLGTPHKTCADIISPYYKWLNKAVVARLHRQGFKVIPWTVNKPRAWGCMKRIGVDAILTDNPGGLIEYLAASGRAAPDEDLDEPEPPSQEEEAEALAEEY